MRKTSIAVRLFSLMCAFLFSIFSVVAEAAPRRISFQSKIYKPDGTPLENSNVQFKFSLMNPLSTCVLYSETFSSVDMLGSSGSVVLVLGDGTRSYPVAGGMTWYDAFDNATASYTCQSTGTFSPTFADQRRLVMQFNDGSGWQTLPPMDINSVPYAMFAESAETVPVTGIMQGGANIGEVLKWNGTSWAASADNSSGGGGGVSSVTSANNYLTITNTTTTPSLTINVGTAINTLAAGDDPRIVGAFQAATVLSGDLTGTLPNPVIATGAVTDAKIANVAWSKVTGTPTTVAGYNISDALSASTNYSGDVSGTYNALALNTIGAGGTGSKITYDTKGRVTGASNLNSGDITTALGYTPSATNSQWNSNLLDIYYNTGNVGIGTTTPSTKLEVAGTIYSTTGGFKFPDGTTQTTAATGASSDWTKTGNDLSYSAGSVGIGTTTPGYKFDIEGNVTPLMRIKGNGASYASSAMVMENGANDPQGVGIYYFDPMITQREWFWGKPYGMDAMLLTRSAPATVTHDQSIASTFGNGTTMLSILADGSMGVGTASPGAKLEVAGQVKITGGSPGVGKVLTSDANGLATWETAGGGASSDWTKTGNDLSYSAGNVGIGTTTPAEKLSIVTSGSANNLSIDTSGSGIAGITIKNLGVAKGYWAAATNATDYFGDAAPGDMIFRSESNNILLGRAGGDSALKISNADATFKARIISSTAPGSIAYEQSSNGAFYINSAGVPGGRFSVLESGNIGIGVAAPTQKLQVAGTIESTTGGFKFPDGTTQTTAATGGGASSDWTKTGSDLSYGAGKVGIGTVTPRQSLDVNGNILVGDVTAVTGRPNGGGFGANVIFDGGWKYIANGPGSLFWSGSSGELSFWTAPNGNAGDPAGVVERFRMSPSGGFSLGNATFVGTDPGAENMILSGNMGVGAVSPTEKLQVAGNIRLGTTGINTDENGDYSITTGGQLKIAANDGSTNDGAYYGLSLSSGSAGGNGLIELATAGTTRMSIYNDVVTVAGRVKIEGGSPGNGKVLMSDANGLASWQSNTQALPIKGGIDSHYNQGVDYVTQGSAGAVPFSILNGETYDVGGVINLGGANGSSYLSPVQIRFFTQPGFVSTTGQGEQRMIINASGNVGIGTGSPNYTLDVSGDVNVTGNFKVNGTNFTGSKWTATGGDIYRPTGMVGIGVAPSYPLDVAGVIHASDNMIVNSGKGFYVNDVYHGMKYDATTDGPHVFGWTGASLGYGTTKVVSTSGMTTTIAGAAMIAGTVGIGTNNPQSPFVIANGNNLQGLEIQPNATFIRIFGYDRNGGAYLPVYFDHKLGVGISNPSEALSVAGKIESTTGGFKFPDGSTQTTAAVSSWAISGNDTYYNNGNVGIGTSTPTAPLTIDRGNGAGPLDPANDGSTYITLGPWKTSGGHDYRIGVDNGTMWFGASANYRWSNSQNGNTFMALNSGNLGVGTNNPLAKFTVANGDNQQGLEMMPYASYFNMYAYDRNGGAFLPIKFDSSVGIGIAAPSEKLSVAGKIESTSGGFKFPDGTTQTTASTALWTANPSGDISYAAGKVGVGVTNPVSSLHVVSPTLEANFSGSNPTPGAMTIQSPWAGYGVTSYHNLDFTNGSWIQGRIGVASIGNSAAEMHFGIRPYSGVQIIDAMMIDSNANVGIGTTTPGYKLQVGNPADGTEARANAWNVLSDERLKKNFTRIENPLQKLLKIGGYTYNWNRGTDNSLKMGVKAQEVQAVFPEVVSEGADGYLSVSYNHLVAPVIEAVKELNVKCEMSADQQAQLAAQVAKHDRRIASLEEDNANLKSRLEKTEKEATMLKQYLCAKDPAASFCK